MINPIIHAYLERNKATLARIVKHADIPAPKLKEALMYCLFPGGKRLRALLVYLTGEIVNANTEALDYIAAAIELSHGYSLIQDDLPVMDNDDFRRGRPTCHRAFDEATAILVSDGMQNLAHEVLLTELPRYLNDKQIIDITTTLLRSSGFAGMLSGQHLDLTLLSQPDVTVTQLQQVHHLKTGALFSACIQMALISGTQCDKTSELLSQYGRILGLTFQMQDDYQDKYGSTERSGKNRASDAANQKMTFAQILNQQALLDQIDQLYHEALLALTPFGEKAKNLKELTRYLQQRTQ